MGVFPEERSVLIMDNCQIHHTDTLLDVLNAEGSFPLYNCCASTPEFCLRRDNASLSTSLLSRPKPH
jgi:hypothetical protein